MKNFLPFILFVIIGVFVMRRFFSKKTEKVALEDSIATSSEKKLEDTTADGGTTKKLDDSTSRFLISEPAGFSGFANPPHATEKTQNRIVSSALKNDCNYNVVGESYRMENLNALVNKHNARNIGKIYCKAILEPEPSNQFDASAVRVIIEGYHVGYIPKLDSLKVSKMILKSGKSNMEVGALIGWDKKAIEPRIGVKIDLEL